MKIKSRSEIYMKNFKDVLKAVGMYMIFLLVVVIVILILNGGYSAGGTLVDMVRIAIEVLIFTLIASLFFRKQPQNLYPLIIGIILTAIWYSTGIFSQIQLFKSYEGIAAMTNISADFAYFVSNAQQQVKGGLFTYMIDWFLLKSDFIPLLLTTIFFINYRKCQLNSLSWGKTLWNITKAFLPVIGIIAYFVIVTLVFPNAEKEGLAILNLLSAFLFADIYLATRLRRKVIEKQKEEIKIKKSKYKIVPVGIFSLLSLVNIYLLFTNPLPRTLIYLVLTAVLVTTIVLIISKPHTGAIFGIISVTLYGVERFITSISSSNDAIVVVGFILAPLFTIGMVLLLINFLLTYGNFKKEKILKELWKKDFSEKKISPEEEYPKHNPGKSKLKILSLIALVIIMLGLLGGAFYWFAYRPEQIRKSCYEEIGNPKILNGYKEQQYKGCLARHGF